MASSLPNDLIEHFEKWLKAELEAKACDADSDIEIVLNFIISTLSDEETNDEEKSESIRPFLAELNKVSFLISLI